MCLIFVGQGYPRKLFNLEHFPIYGISLILLCLAVPFFAAQSCFCLALLNYMLNQVRK